MRSSVSGDGAGTARRGTRDTLVRIMDGALVTLSRHGGRKMSMSDVTVAAGISRGTLYRHFSNKDDLLKAIAAYIRAEMQQELAAAVARRPALSDRVEVVLEAVIAFAATHPIAVQVITAEPEFGTGFVRDVFPEFVAVAEKLMLPALARETDDHPVLSAGRLAELGMRLASSTYFIPTGDFTNIAQGIAGLLTRRATNEEEELWEDD